MTKISLRSYAFILASILNSIFSNRTFASVDFVRGKVQATIVVKRDELFTRLKFTGAVANHIMERNQKVATKTELRCFGTEQDATCLLFVNRSGKIVDLDDRQVEETSNAGSGFAILEFGQKEIEFWGLAGVVANGGIKIPSSGNLREGEQIACEIRDFSDPYETYCKVKTN